MVSEGHQTIVRRCELVITTVKGVVTAKGANRLAENGGPMLITKDWAKRIAW